MASHPTHGTSNYGWSIWHLEQADLLRGPHALAEAHLAAAQARATLALVDEHEAARGQNDWAGSTWSGGADRG